MKCKCILLISDVSNVLCPVYIHWVPMLCVMLGNQPNEYEYNKYILHTTESERNNFPYFKQFYSMISSFRGLCSCKSCKFQAIELRFSSKILLYDIVAYMHENWWIIYIIFIHRRIFNKISIQMSNNKSSEFHIVFIYQ